MDDSLRNGEHVALAKHDLPVLELDHQLAGIPGLRYKVDRNPNLVYFELDEPTITFREIRAIFLKLSPEPRFIGAIPPELRPKTKTQPLGV